MRKTCLDCALKHVGQALVLLDEAVMGYPLHRWLAVGHLGEAASELYQLWPEMAMRIRDERLLVMEDAEYHDGLMQVLEMLDEHRGSDMQGCSEELSK